MLALVMNLARFICYKNITNEWQSSSITGIVSLRRMEDEFITAARRQAGDKNGATPRTTPSHPQRERRRDRLYRSIICILSIHIYELYNVLAYTHIEHISGMGSVTEHR